MKVTPQIVTDLDEYPELRRLIEASLRRVAELMEIHDIIELRRLHKTGVFDHPYTKDIVTPIGVPGVPSTVSAVRYSVGKALLDYLETIGVHGIGLDLTKEDAVAISSMWAPPQQTPAQKKEEDDLKPEPVAETPTPAPEAEKQPDTPAEPPEPKPAETPVSADTAEKEG